MHKCIHLQKRIYKQDVITENVLPLNFNKTHY